MIRSLKIKLMLLAAVLLASGVALSAPQLKAQSEVVGDGSLKLKVLSGSTGILPPTPQAKMYSVTSNGVQSIIKVYDEKEVAYTQELIGMWRDKKGNEMRLALPKKYPWGEGITHKTTVEVGGNNYYIDFTFSERVSEADAKKLLKAAASSLSNKTAGMSKSYGAMKWWESKNKYYRFLTDLDKAKGGKFIADAMKLMGAMHNAYEYYIPASGTNALCTVRVFATLKGYQEYRAATGVNDTMSCGLWDPSREELLIVAEDKTQAQETMRHEGFHQYLYYATKYGYHATWFNEGHATFFENVQYNAAKNSVKILDKGSRVDWLNQNPEKYAVIMGEILRMGHEEFYSGNANDKYVAAWGLMYFLERGAYTSDNFKAYREVVPTYLKSIAKGLGPNAATQAAWQQISVSQLKSDFLTFWKEKRKSAQNARENMKGKK